MYKLLASIIILLAIAIPAGGFWIVQRAYPVMDGIYTIPQLYRPVTVRFDEHAVPYLDGTTESDVYIAQGYLTASERMFQMDMLRRMAKGELSEVFGSAALLHDKLMRTVGIGRLAREEFKKLPKKAKDCLKAYAQGVNVYTDTILATRPPVEFLLLGYRPNKWTAEDSLAIMKLKQYELDESWRLDDLRQRIANTIGSKEASLFFGEQLKAIDLIGENSSETTKLRSNFRATCDMTGRLLAGAAVLPGPRPSWGSTAFVIGPKLADGASSLLAADKHALLASPGDWYECSLKAPGLHACGVTIPGVPGVIYGRNDDIAWSASSIKADTQDIYLEHFSPDFPGKYRTASGWKNAEETVEEIPSRFGVGKIVHRFLTTRHGPLLFKNGATGVALSWTGETVGMPDFYAYYELNRAKTWKDFENALSQYNGSPQTFVYTDKDHKIGFQDAGAIPIRGGSVKNQQAGNLMLPGWLDTMEWTGRVGYASMPCEIDGDAGYYIAGQEGFFARSDKRGKYRTDRIRQVIENYQKIGQKIGLQEAYQLQGDQYAMLSPLVKDQLAKAINRQSIIDRVELTALDSIDHWDGQMQADSPAATIYETFLQTVARRLFEPKLKGMTAEYIEMWPGWLPLVEKLLRDRPAEWLPPDERNYETFLITAFSESLKNIRLASHSDDPKDWAWKNFHKATFRHIIANGLNPDSHKSSGIYSWLFDNGPLGVGGDAETVSSLNAISDANNWTFTADSGPTERMLIDMSDEDKFYLTLSLGQSGQLGSRFRSDQLRFWLASKQPCTFAFSDHQIDRDFQYKLILSDK